MQELVKQERPKVLESITEEVQTGCGHLFITIGYGPDDKPIEVLVTLGKAGGCSHCQNEALSRVVSLGLRYGIPVEDYIKQLVGNECPSRNLWPEDERILSCADGLGQVLSRYPVNTHGHDKT